MFTFFSFYLGIFLFLSFHPLIFLTFYLPLYANPPESNGQIDVSVRLCLRDFHATRAGESQNVVDWGKKGVQKGFSCWLLFEDLSISSNHLQARAATPGMVSASGAKSENMNC